MLRTIRRTACVLALGLAPVAAGAQGITGLWNTGVNGAGNQLSPGQTDTHYTVNENAGAQAMTYLHPAYAVDPNSQYIWQQSDGNPGSVTRTFRTTFTVASGYDPLTAFLAGAWSTDNQGLDIFLNGISTGNGSPTFSYFTAFTITSGFVAGLNTLEFRVADYGPPGALDVTNLRGNAQLAVVATPEPASVLLMATGFLGLGVTRLRRKTRA